MSLIQELQPRHVLSTNLPGRAKVYRELRQHPNLEAIASGTCWDLSEDASLEVLFPPADYLDQASADDECLVLRLTWYDWRLLLLSDSGFKTEKWLLDHVEDLRADVLVKSQHSSDYSGLGEFILKVDPAAIVATNDQFPSNEALAESWRTFLTRQDVALFDQASTGAVLIQIEAEELQLQGFLNGQVLKLRR